jgi:predicted TIM-barrel fold metal-dependent hydrolase
MIDTFLPPVTAPSRPRRPTPPGACDAHVHIFGPFNRFPLSAERSYSSPELPASAFLALLDAIGFERGVLVQPSAYGTDNRAMLHGLAESPIRLRGVAVTRSETSRVELVGMRELGVRGLRFTEIPGDLAFQGTVGVDELEQLAPTLRDLALHAQLWTTCDWFASAAPRLVKLGVPLVLDHMALFDTRLGVDAPAFQNLLRLLGDGQIWIKLTPYRLSRKYPDYEDVRPFHEALVYTNPERLLWGSDWPHVHMKSRMPDDGHLVDLFDDWTGDDALRERILVENPARLYEF